MKKVIFLLAIFVFFTVGLAVYAQPPSKINITFDQNTKILKVVITHNTNGPTSHYVNKVVISLKDRDIIIHNLLRQDNKETQTLSYLISEAEKGNLLAVEAYCNVRGSLKEEIIVGDES